MTLAKAESEALLDLLGRTERECDDLKVMMPHPRTRVLISARRPRAPSTRTLPASSLSCCTARVHVGAPILVTANVARNRPCRKINGTNATPLHTVGVPLEHKLHALRWRHLRRARSQAEVERLQFDLQAKESQSKDSMDQLLMAGQQQQVREFDKLGRKSLPRRHGAQDV